MQSKYQTYGGSGDGSDFDNVTVKQSPFTIIEANITRAFGASPPWGEQTLGVAYEDVVLVDGALYVDPDTEKLKTFSWKETIGLNPVEAIEEGAEFGPDQAPDRLTKTYGDTTKTYRLVGAVHGDIFDAEDDETPVYEAASMYRDYETDGEGGVEFGDFEEGDGGPIPVADEVITWHSGSSEYGPSTVSKRLATLLTVFGSDMVVSEDDIGSWLADTSGDNVIRDDLQDRRVQVIMTQRQNEDAERSYNFPVLEDVKTGEPVQLRNDDGEGDSGN